MKDEDSRSPKYLIASFVDIISKSGNYLPNIGPDGVGVVLCDSPGPKHALHNPFERPECVRSLLDSPLSIPPLDTTSLFGAGPEGQNLTWTRDASGETVIYVGKHLFDKARVHLYTLPVTCHSHIDRCTRLVDSRRTGFQLKYRIQNLHGRQSTNFEREEWGVWIVVVYQRILIVFDCITCY